MSRTAKAKAFTLMELMVGVVILTIIVSISSVGYRRYQDRAAMLVDETNQKVLLAAVKLYAYDNNALPGSLSRLQERHLNRAYAMVTEGKKPYTVLAFLKEQVSFTGIAEAIEPQPSGTHLPDRYFGETAGDKWKMLTCPMDASKPSAATPSNHSYAIHANASGRPLSWLLNPANANQPIIGESDSATTSTFTRRHNGGRTFVYTTAAGDILRDTYASGGSITPSEGGDINTTSEESAPPPP